MGTNLVSNKNEKGFENHNLSFPIPSFHSNRTEEGESIRNAKRVPRMIIREIYRVIMVDKHSEFDQ